MANENPQAVAFCNQRLRVACDSIITAIRTLRQMDAEATTQGIQALVAGTQQLMDALIVDGSATDGRTPLTGYDVSLALGAAQALLAWCDGAGAAQVAALTKPSVNTQPRF